MVGWNCLSFDYNQVDRIGCNTTYGTVHNAIGLIWIVILNEWFRLQQYMKMSSLYCVQVKRVAVAIAVAKPL
jgi:hypothetical protein